MAAVALMDARSIAATVRNGGRLTAATELDQVHYTSPEYHFNPAIYKGQVYDNFGGGNPAEPLVMGPNIGEWPEMGAFGGASAAQSGGGLRFVGDHG